MFDFCTINYAEIIFVFIATFGGVFFAFYLEGRRSNKAEKEQFLSFMIGLHSEIKNNIKIIEKGESIAPISFEVYKFVLGNNIFYKYYEKYFGKRFIDEMWSMVNELRKVKANKEYAVNALGIYIKSEEFKKLKITKNRIEEYINLNK
jgi:hypothetical protein